MNGQEQVRRRETLAPCGQGTGRPGVPPSAMVVAGEIGVLEGVERDPERCRVGERLDPQLHEVGGVARVLRVRRVDVGPGRPRERVAGEAGVVPEGVALRPAVVVQEVLVEEFAIAVGAGARDQDRRRLPRAGVLQLRRVGERLVEDVRAGPLPRALVQGRRRQRPPRLARSARRRMRPRVLRRCRAMPQCSLNRREARSEVWPHSTIRGSHESCSPEEPHAAVAGCALAAVVAGCGSDDATSSGLPIPRGSER